MLEKEENNLISDTITNDSLIEQEETTVVKNIKKLQQKKHVMFFTRSQDSSTTTTREQIRDSANKSLWGNPILGTYSIKVTCSNCQHYINTEVDYQGSWLSYAATAVTAQAVISVLCALFILATWALPFGAFVEPTQMKRIRTKSLPDHLVKQVCTERTIVVKYWFMKYSMTVLYLARIVNLCMNLWLSVYVVYLSCYKYTK